MDERPAIRVSGARQNNLKGFDVTIPHEALTVITGVSGSGKSSLAFQTLYAEGQRRYSESFSAYVRQFLERLPQPQVDAVDGMLPAIAIEQGSGGGGARSTVATLTDLADYLKLLWARAAVLHCPDCGDPVHEASAPTIRDHLLSSAEGRRVLLAFPVLCKSRAEAKRQGEVLIKLGYRRRVRVAGWDGADGPLAEAPEVAELTKPPGQPGTYWFLVDRLRVEKGKAERLLEAVEQALHLTSAPLAALVEEAAGTWRAERHAPGLRCQKCDRAFDPPTPHLFSYNTPVGACDECGGFGRVMDIDWDLVIPDHRLSLAEGAIKPWTTPKTAWEREHLAEICEAAKIPMDVPWGKLPAAARQLVTLGDDQIWGVKDWFDWLETRTYRTHVRIFLSRFRAYRTCPTCHGSRLKPEALAFQVDGKTLADIYRLDVAAARAFFQDVRLPAGSAKALSPVLGEIQRRLGYLDEVGVGYLTLDRQARTLSGGESQRVTLTTALGAGLVHTLFVLDEPTVGLHPRDTQRLVAILGRLTDHANTVVVVEHDPDLIQAADHLIDLGPGAGEAGGELIYAGPPEALLARSAHSARSAQPNRRGRRGARARASVTAEMMQRRGHVLAAPPPRRSGVGKPLRIQGARAHNLQDLDVRLPLGVLTCVTGVSGSGKSTLVEHVLFRGLSRKLGRPVEPPGAHRDLTNWQGIKDVVYVDQLPVASSPRATPLTYVGIFDRIRQLFAKTDEALTRGFGPGTFSWNTAGGRCEACEGTGVTRVELHFLPDALIPCEVCEGRRFTAEVLSVTWQGLSIHDVLRLTVNEALEIFASEERVARGLKILADVGLSYLRLGQGLNTLSGGESQRLKVARHLALERAERTLFLLDEPTRGLHLADVGVLVQALHQLVDRGNTVVVVEHHPEVIWQADHVIDLGPEGGAAGGQVVAQGPPEQVLKVRGSHTGRFLCA